MLRAVNRLLMVIGAGIVGILFILVLIVRLRATNTKLSPEELVATLKNAGLVELLATLGGAGELFLFEAALLACATLIVVAALFYLLRKIEPALDANAAAQTRFLDTLDIRYVDLAIVFSAALSLFLELALIRWQSSVMEFIAFYKNFSLPFEGQKLTLRMELYNAFNHVQFGFPATDFTVSTFGRITSTATQYNPRIIQFALRYTF